MIPLIPIIKLAVGGYVLYRVGKAMSVTGGRDLPPIPEGLTGWQDRVAAAGGSSGKGYVVTQADLDAVDAKNFVHPNDWLVPRVGTVIPAKYLGGPNDVIPGCKWVTWKMAANSKDGPVPPLWRPITALSAQAIEIIGDAAGERPKVTSWWRGPISSRDTDQGEYKRRGGWGGYHPSSAALDLYIPSWVEADKARGKQRLYDLIEALIKAGKLPDGGLGIYGDKYKIVHYDPRSALTGKHGKQWRSSRWDRRPDPITGTVDLTGG